MENEKKKNPIKDEDLDQVTGGIGYDGTIHPENDVNNDIPEPDPFIPLIPPTLDGDGFIIL